MKAGDTSTKPEADSRRASPCLSRRALLLSGGAAITLVAVGISPTEGETQTTQQALLASYPRQPIGQLSALKVDQPAQFAYPYPNLFNVLVRLGVRSGGGIGPQQDVVAFSQQCTHMGGPLQGSFKPGLQMLGPCPLHLTTYDLTRHGMVVSGHGTESLPQIVLETAGDDIFAVGVMGLIYGYSRNLSRV